MSALTKVPTTAKPCALEEPELSRGLRVEIDRFIDPTPGVLVAVARATDRDEAASAIAAYEALCAPATSTAVCAWLWAIAKAVRNPPADEPAFRQRLETIFRASGDLPIGVWTEDTQGRALRTMKFWPSAADVDEFVRPIGDRLRRQLRNLHKVAGAEVLQPARGVTRSASCTSRVLRTFVLADGALDSELPADPASGAGESASTPTWL